MKKIKRVGTVSEFLNKKGTEERSVIDKVVAHIEDNQAIYYTAGVGIIILTVGHDFGLVDFAAGEGISGIDAKARQIYDKLLYVAKWIIVTKGGLEVIRSVTDGDIDSVKKSFLGHLFVFLLLLAYPWAMDEVENLFNS